MDVVPAEASPWAYAALGMLAAAPDPRCHSGRLARMQTHVSDLVRGSPQICAPPSSPGRGCNQVQHHSNAVLIFVSADYLKSISPTKMQPLRQGERQGLVLDACLEPNTSLGPWKCSVRVGEQKDLLGFL